MADMFSSIYNSITGLMGPIMDAVDSLLYPLIAVDPNPENPILALFIVAFIVSVVITIANKLLVNQEEMNEIRQEMKEFQNELKEAQQSGDSKKLAKLQAQQSEFMQKQSKMMTNSFKPAIITMVPILLVFWWMASSQISSLIVQLPVAVYYGTLTPIFHTIGPLIYGGSADIPYTIGWLLWYFICTLSISQILRKFLGMSQSM